MKLCPHCHQPIRYIISNDTILTVNLQEKTVITERGRQITGYELHQCECPTDQASSRRTE